MVGIPPGITLIRRLRGGKNWSLDTYKHFVLLLTFLAYACYHASRKPTSIVKSVLDPQIRRSGSSYPWPVGNVFVKDDGVAINMTISHGEGWAPFNGEDGTAKLGEIDVAFLSCYSMGMYVAGHLGDTLDLRLFLAAGMMGSGIFVGLFGMGYFWNIHFFGFYLGMQMIAGLFQATGWPSVVAVIGNWFGKARRGLIMGVWNAHTSVGNIIGSLVAAAVLQYGWGWSFILPGALMFSGGIMVYLLLPPYPELLGLPCPYGRNAPNTQATTPNDEESLIQGGDDIQPEVSSSHQDSSVDRGGAVGLAEACLIPGVIPFALCLFFSKLVAYTFLYWLPFYLSQTAIGGEYVSVKSAGNLSTLFDVGGIVGGILAGYISDKLKARAITAATFTFCSIPALLLYRIYGGLSQSSNIALMMLAGLFVNGPYSLITTAVSADLGTQSLRGNARALATVTAIIDGTGSVGAAIGPLLTGFLSKKGWDAVFIMLVVGAAVAGILLTRLVVAEIAARPWNQNSQTNDSGQQGIRGSAAERLLYEERRR